MKPILGCIADDFTGATDLASMLKEGGMRVVQILEFSNKPLSVEVDVVIIALKSRSIPKDKAVTISLEALKVLQGLGCSHFYFKYCSTFDSTDRGNIGAVIEALLDALGESFTLACPAYPENGRTVFNGHLFVGTKLLSESGMENHPLTPMKDSNLVRVLQKQTNQKVGLIDFSKFASLDLLQQYTQDLNKEKIGIAIADAIEDKHLMALGLVFGSLKLLTGSSGLALGLPAYYRKKGLLKDFKTGFSIKRIEGFEAVISGSCSKMTLLQVEKMKESCYSFKIDIEEIDNPEYTKNVIDTLGNHLLEGPVLVYSSSSPEEVSYVQESMGQHNSGKKIEDILSNIALGLVAKGVTKLIIAGGETSGAVLKALNISSLEIGQVINPGIPWTQHLKKPNIALALKSGNFGNQDFFVDAFNKLNKL